MVEIRLDLLLKHFHDIYALAPIVLPPLLVATRQLITLIEPMNVLKGLAQWTRHLLVQVLMVSFRLLHSIGNELVRACLLDVIVKPGQIELIHAEANQVEE